MRDAITSFCDEYEYLSNFYEVDVQWDGRTYRNSEAAFQSAKTLDPQIRDSFTLLDPLSAKRKGRQVALRSDWETVKSTIMETVVRAKFRQHLDLAKRLMETGNAELMEGNDWNDTCWGVDLRTGEGENRLGKILMSVREELQSAGESRCVDASLMDDILEAMYDRQQICSSKGDDNFE